MSYYRIYIIVKEVRGYCAAGYKPGDTIIIEKFYVKPQHTKICLHALNSMLTLLMPFLKGISAKSLGIGMEDHRGYIQCPDPGKPYTSGGTVVFELIRRKIQE
ncbi:MAG: TIGR04076 family protein [Thermoprotei archaeon]|nr:MAG: TIGR04076 family protein [Thermoprotei archaeon]